MWILIVAAIVIVAAIAFKIGQNSKSKQVKSIIIEAFSSVGRDNKENAWTAMNRLPAVLPGLMTDLEKTSYSAPKPVST